MIKNIIKVFKSVREYKIYAIITPIFMIGEAAVECLLPFFMSRFVDKIETISSIVELLPFVGVLVLLACISITCGILGGRFASIASCGFAKNLRNDLYKKIESFSFENIDHFSTSSLVTRMTTDVNNAQQSFQMCTRIIFRAPLMLLFSAIMAFITGRKMAFIFVAALPILIVGFLLIISNAMKIFKRVFKRYDKLNESVQENVSGIRVVKSYVREDFEKEKFNAASNDMTKDFVKGEKIVALTMPMMNTSIHAVYLITLYVASTIIFNTVGFEENDAGQVIIKVEDGVRTVLPSWGELSIPKMSALLTYGIQILANLMMLSMIMTMLVMSLEGIKRIAEVLDEEPTIHNPENPIMEVEDGSVTFKNVNFKYKAIAEKNTLENINVTIKSGQFVGILGSTGSGKTTLVNLISRLYDISEGELLVGGKPVNQYDLKVLRDAVAVVLQKNFLFSGTLRENMQWGDKNASDEEITKAIAIAQIPESITAVKEGLDRKVEQSGSNFSGGQKQRLCIARALLKNPKILILDDSTSAVDTRTDRLIRKGLKEDLPAMTKIVIAQRISSIEEADQIIIMNDGHIDAIGTHEELLENNEIYQEIYYTQTKKGDK